MHNDFARLTQSLNYDHFYKKGGRGETIEQRGHKMTNENTELDVEWAKRGGIVYGKYDFGGNYLFRLVDCHISRNEYLLYPLFCFEKIYNDRLGSRVIFLRADAMERMATREECTVAGVEYIERHMSAEELASLREDKELLDFMHSTVSSVYFSPSGGGMYVSTLNDKILSTGKTPREAIRAAMKGGV